jgi:hypothetical protein
VTTVVLQRGHVPRTTGAVGAPGEQAYARGVATRTVPLLQALGVTVRIIDADEPDARYRGDLFFALHYDGGPPAARGASVGWRTPEGRALAALWKAAYRKHAGNRVGPFRADNYTAALAGYYGHGAAVRVGNRPAVILEGGFGSHTAEGPWLRSDAGMTACALAIRDAVADHLGRAIPAATPPEDVMTPAQERKLDQAIADAAEAKANTAKILEQLGGRRIGDDLRRIRISLRPLGRKLGIPVDVKGDDDGSTVIS